MNILRVKHGEHVLSCPVSKNIVPVAVEEIKSLPRELLENSFLELCLC